jgi:putative membrane protein
VRGLSGRSSTGNTPTAQDILRDRYARGEIDEDEFERRKAKLDM